MRTVPSADMLIEYDSSVAAVLVEFGDSAMVMVFIVVLLLDRVGSNPEFLW